MCWGKRKKEPKQDFLNAKFEPNKEHNAKFVFVGDTAVGKTSVIRTYDTGVYPDLYEPTVFDLHGGIVAFDNA